MTKVPGITDANYKMDTSSAYLMEKSLQEHTLLKKFIEDVNKDISELNLLIVEYNLTKGTPQKIEMLQNIYRRKQQMDNKYSDTQISLCSDYHKEFNKTCFWSFKNNCRA